jgi:hypothetical protein
MYLKDVNLPLPEIFDLLRSFLWRWASAPLTLYFPDPAVSRAVSMWYQMLILARKRRLRHAHQAQMVLSRSFPVSPVGLLCYAPSQTHFLILLEHSCCLRTTLIWHWPSFRRSCTDNGSRPSVCSFLVLSDPFTKLRKLWHAQCTQGRLQRGSYRYYKSLRAGRSESRLARLRVVLVQ